MPSYTKEQKRKTVELVDEGSAASCYFEREAESDANLVLVRDSSISPIKRAYPNYFGDLSEFTSTTRGLVG